MFLFTPYYDVTSCKFSRKYYSWLLRKVDINERTDVRMDARKGRRILRSDTKVGGPKRRSNLTSGYCRKKCGHLLETSNRRNPESLLTQVAYG